ncbi:hypothetical protein E8E11_004962 [Didymella keratinophila]|nr:hypothetical protein E8E11_004962 [Didymella keratinophila]
MRQERCHYTLSEIKAVIGHLFQKQIRGDPKIWTEGKDDSVYHSPLRILQGKLPNGLKLQLILVPPGVDEGMRTVLRFWAFHVMSIFGGTLAAHLYHDLTSQDKAFEFDLRGSDRHAGAMKAKEKYRDERGWTFIRAPNLSKARTAVDEDVLSVGFENVWRSIFSGFQSFRKPDWWENYFQERINAFRTYSWYQESGKILNPTMCGGSVAKQGIVC